MISVEKQYPAAQDIIFNICILIFLDAALLCVVATDKRACTHSVTRDDSKSQRA